MAIAVIWTLQTIYAVVLRVGAKNETPGYSIISGIFKWFIEVGFVSITSDIFFVCFIRKVDLNSSSIVDTFYSEAIWKSITSKTSARNYILLSFRVYDPHYASALVSKIHFGSPWSFPCIDQRLFKTHSSTVRIITFWKNIAPLDILISLALPHTISVRRAKLLIFLAFMGVVETRPRKCIATFLVSPDQMLLHVSIGLVVSKSVHKSQVESRKYHVVGRSRVHLTQN